MADNALADSTPPPPSQSPSPHNDPGGIGSGTVEVEGTPFVGAAELPEPAIEPTPPREANNAGEAVLLSVVFGALVRKATHQPLTDAERAKWARDAQPVLEKYNVPSLLPPEESQLLATTAELLLPRVIAMAESDDRNVSGKEGQRQEHSTPPDRPQGAAGARIKVPGMA